MKAYSINLMFIGVVLISVVQAREVLYLSFDDTLVNLPNFVEFHGDRKLTNGLSRNGLAMTDQKDYLVLDLSSVDYERFTISYWVKLGTDTDAFNIFTHEVGEDGAKQFSLNVQDNRFYVTDPASGKIDKELADGPVKGQWMHMVYTYDAGQVYLSVQSSNDVYINERYLFDRSAGENQQFTIAENTQFNVPTINAVIDDLRLYDTNEFKFVKRSNYQLLRDSMLAKVPRSASEVEEFWGRQNIKLFADTLRVESSELGLEIWDNDRKDGDEITVFLNGIPLGHPVKLLKKKFYQKIIGLQPGHNKLIFYANNMGEFSSFNTSSINLSGLERQIKETEVKCDDTKNVVIDLFYDQSVALLENNGLVYEPYPLDHSLVSGEDSIVLELFVRSKSNLEQVVLKINETSIPVELLLNKDYSIYQLPLNQYINALYVGCKNSFSQGCQFSVDISEKKSGRKINHSVPIDFDLRRGSGYKLPVKFDPHVNIIDSITVSTDSLLLRFTDTGAEDGDRIYANLNGETVVEEFQLKNDAIDHKIIIQRDNYNLLEINPIKRVFGTPGFSCRLEIWDKYLNKKFSDLNILARLDSRPTKIVIEYDIERK